MGTREKFHQLIDTIKDEQVLADYYAFMLMSTDPKDGKLSDNLSPEQKAELELSYQESLNPENLMDHETIVQRYSKWL